MAARLSRRDFLKVTGLGTAATAISLIGERYDQTNSGPTPGIIFNPVLAVKNGAIATTCTRCGLNCGLLVHVADGSITSISGNPGHPVNRGGICPEIKTMFESQRAETRILGPMLQTRRGSGRYSWLDWGAAESVLAKNLLQNSPHETVFITGSYPDHLFDFLSVYSIATGGLPVFRFSDLSVGDSSLRLREASQKIFGSHQLPYFDTENSDLVFAFGLNGSEPWLSGPSRSRHIIPRKQGTWIHFSSKKPIFEDYKTEWIPIKLGSEAQIAVLFADLVASINTGISPYDLDHNLDAISSLTFLVNSEIIGLAQRFTSAERKLAMPGNTALWGPSGFSAAEAIFKLNILASNLGKTGGVFLLPPAPIYPHNRLASASSLEWKYLIDRMKAGRVKTLLVHGNHNWADSELWDEFMDALSSVKCVISFSSSMDEISKHADYVLPDHNILESWGYQKVIAGFDRVAISGIQPVYYPSHNTRATITVLLNAIQRIRGDLTAALPFQSESDFLQGALQQLDRPTEVMLLRRNHNLGSNFFEQGGWWPSQATLIPPVSII